MSIRLNPPSIENRSTSEIRPRFRGFKVKYFGPGNVRGSRLKITDLRHNESVTMGIDDTFRDSHEQAYNWLLARGIPIVAQMLERNEEVFLTDNFNIHIV